MSQLKTAETADNVLEFIAGLEDERRREDALCLHAIMARVTGEHAAMWGSSIVGFGRYHYRYDSGHEGDSFMVGFSPRKQNLVVYIMPGFSAYGDFLDRLGKYRTGKSCLYINKLADIDTCVLEELVLQSFKEMKRRYN
jgi:hypothetical protein